MIKIFRRGIILIFILVIMYMQSGTCYVQAANQIIINPAAAKQGDFKKVKASRITLNKKKLILKVGKRYRLKASMSPEKTTDNIKWSSDNVRIATVTKRGIVTAIRKGTTKITAKSTSGKQVSCRIKIKPKHIAVKKIILNRSELSLKKGKTAVLHANIYPKNAYDKNIRWKSSNAAIAAVSKSGKLRAVRTGTATITAEGGNGQKASCIVKVSKVKEKKEKISYKDIKITSRFIDETIQYRYHMTVTAQSENGAIIWNYRTSTQQRAEIDAFHCFEKKDKVYIWDAGKLILLDKVSGNKMWTMNAAGIAFGGYAFDNDDNLYICGWYGPALTAISKDGRKLWTIEKIGDFYRPYRIQSVNGILQITFEGGLWGSGKAFVSKQGVVLNIVLD